MTLDECIKYVESHMEVRYATKNFKFKAADKMIPEGCVNHSVGTAQPSLDVWYKLMNETDKWAVNAILGDFHLGEGKILLVMPLDYKPAGCGPGSKGSWNTNRIQWEIAEPAGHKYNGGTMIGYDAAKNQPYFDRMWKLLVAWNVYCAHKYGYDSKTINDHAESYKAGYGSNHADVGHWFPRHGKNMDILRQEVQQILDNTKIQSSTTLDNAPDAWGKEAVNWAILNKILLGNEKGDYKLHSNCTRQDMLIFLYRAKDILKTKAEEVNVPKYIWDFLKGKGFNDFAIAGIMGNLYAESGLNPVNLQNTFENKLGMTDVQYTEAVDSGKYTNFGNDRAGYGLAQWTFWSRKQGLLDYAKSVKKSIGNLDMQLEYFYKELTESYGAACNALAKAATVRAASDVILLQYERPADMSVAMQEKRAAYGQGYYDQYATKTLTKGEVNSFSDITKDNKPDAWGKDAVEWAVLNEILFGNEKGDYKLHSNCTRQEMLIFLHRMYKMINS